MTLTPACFDREVKYKWRVGRQKDERTMWSDTKKWGEFSLYLLPEFLQTVAKYDEKKRVLSATAYPRRQVLLSSKVGIGLYPKGNFTNAVAEPEAHNEYSYMDQFNEYIEEFHKPEAGTYNVAPFVRMFGVNMPVNDDKVYAEVTIPPYIEIAQDSVVVTDKKQRLEIPFETNSNKVTVSAVNTVIGTSALNVTVSPHDSIAKQDTLIIEVDENASILGNSGDIVLTATHDDVTASDTLRVIQEGTTITAKNVYASVYQGYKGTWSRHDNHGTDITNETAGDIGFVFNQDQEHKSASVQCSRSGDLLNVEISVDNSKTPWSNDNENYPYFRVSGSGYETIKGHLSLVIDLNSNPKRVISGSLNWETTFYDHSEETDWSDINGTVYISGKSNDTTNKSSVSQGTITSDLQYKESPEWSDERYIRFEGINLKNWFSGSYSSSESFNGTKNNYDWEGICTDNYTLIDNQSVSGSVDTDPSARSEFTLLIFY